MGCIAQINIKVSKQDFNLDEMYDENSSLQQIYQVFKHLDKNWKTLDEKDAHLLEEIFNYLEQNYYQCYVCGVYFEDHPLLILTTPATSVMSALPNPTFTNPFFYL